MDARLWGPMALAAAARVAPTTVGKIRRGEPVRPDCIQRVVDAFLDCPPVEGVSELLADPELLAELEARIGREGNGRRARR